ncbi:flagellar hook-basal body complex protein FliE [Rhizobium tubonense]|uniref:Flagellar hook-basal body complex protein FliE n=1 Tax=Rhizobium tubonense TaxID=484088 RepID=A0A2W4D4G1_9HYPH|nr:flagellar hook-basal body complex protein FliE [Rhizobium tubonense]PZM12314.1 flagellar hook-basal body complex protein FliE [Rhizobium tubonense]
MIDAIKNVASLAMTRGLGSIATDETSAASSAIASTPGTSPGAAGGTSFSSVMTSMAGDMVNNLKQAESASFAGMKGTMGTREVVDAVMQADQSLQTAIALRDKVVSAFLDITKMQI